MCGIAGQLSAGDRRLADNLALMSERVQHRGPDDEGVWLDPAQGIGLAHRRLAVLDLSDAGHQPMVSRNGRWVLVFNGEIYDHREHRTQLEQMGTVFRGHSDTEVFLELIAAEGPAAACAAVNGMFAFGLWDRAEHQLFLGRDRIGEKPLYCGQVGSGFVFASELGAIRRVPGARTAPDPAAVADYLRFGFVPAPRSILPGIGKLPAGTLLRVDRAGAGEPIPYWRLQEIAQRGLADRLMLSDAELVELADTMLKDAVRLRLTADVPVGAFLSGGLDSSTVVALAQASHSTPVNSFTVAVGGADDESEAATAVAKHLGTSHTVLPLPEIDALKLAHGVAAMHDEPFADPSSIPMALLCEAAREHVTVCLSGDGADELLGGYNRYRIGDGGLAALLRLPPPLRRGLSTGLMALNPGRWDALGRLLPGRLPDLGTKLHKLAYAIATGDPVAAYLELATQWDPAEVMADPPAANAPVVAHPLGASALDAMMLADQDRTLPDNMLVKVDRASMAVALEVRVPFLDHRFIELSWRLPQQAKVRNGQSKWLIRQVLSRYVPPELWDRPKVGFDPPLADWLRGPLREWAQDLLSPTRLRRQGILRPEPVAAALAAHLSGRRNNDYPLWTLLMLQAWLEGEGI